MAICSCKSCNAPFTRNYVCVFHDILSNHNSQTETELREIWKMGQVSHSRYKIEKWLWQISREIDYQCILEKFRIWPQERFHLIVWSRKTSTSFLLSRLSLPLQISVIISLELRHGRVRFHARISHPKLLLQSPKKLTTKICIYVLMFSNFLLVLL